VFTRAPHILKKYLPVFPQKCINLLEVALWALPFVSVVPQNF